MPSALFGSMPSLSQSAMRAARRLSRIPDAMTDEEVLAQGIITPEMLELIMMIASELIIGCLDNNSKVAWNRVQSYVNAKAIDRLGDQTRLNLLISKWLKELGYTRDRGDVMFIREAVVQTAGSLKEQEFKELHTEVLFLTI